MRFGFKYMVWGFHLGLARQQGFIVWCSETVNLPASGACSVLADLGEILAFQVARYM